MCDVWDFEPTEPRDEYWQLLSDNIDEARRQNPRQNITPDMMIRMWDNILKLKRLRELND